MTALLVFIALLYTVSFTQVLGVQDVARQQKCDFVFKVQKGKVIDLQTHNFTNHDDQNHYCTMIITADRKSLIVLDLVYAPVRSRANHPTVNCTTDYVHVGNDMGRVDVSLMTSYKFCFEEVRHELVSKANHIWIVFKASQKPKEFSVKVRAQTQEMCSPKQFACSPVQCVDRSAICDGVKNCTNGHDEFCHKVGQFPDGINHKSVSLPEPCFRCGDGTCIQPRLSPYDTSYGRDLWYLCDGLFHCPDAWDEKMDMCSRHQKGRSNLVTECVPSDLQFGHNHSIVMWNQVRCDKSMDCLHGEDEKDCYGSDSFGSKLHADPATLGIVVGILVTACLVICVTYRLRMVMNKASRPSTSSTVDTKCTQCTSVENDSGDAATTGQICNETQPMNVNNDVLVDTNNYYNPNDSNNSDTDGDERSLESLNLKHSIV